MKKKKKFYWKTLVVLSIMACVCFALFMSKNPLSQEEIDQHVRKVTFEHLGECPKTTWFLSNAPQSSTPELMDICIKKKDTLMACADLWCPTNSIGLAIRKRLPDWSWWIADSTNSLGAVNNALVMLPGKIGVILVPSSLSVGVKTSFFCSKKSDGKVLSIKAFEMPPQIFTAFMLHEMGHAEEYWYQDMASGSEREVEMHKLTQHVLDEYSCGGYSECITKILDRENLDSSKDWRRAFEHITPQDLADLDKAIEASGVGRGVEDMLVTQHLLSLGFAAIDRMHLDSGEKVALYDWENSIHN